MTFDVNASTGVRGVVVTPEHIHIPGRSVVSADRTFGANLPGILAGQSLAQHASIVIDGVTPDAHKRHSDQVRGDGWGHSQVDAWTLYHHRDGRTRAVGLRDVMDPAVHFGVLFSAKTDPGVLALQLDRYGGAVGSTWRGTPAASALAALRLSWENVHGKPLWKYTVGGVGLNGAGVLRWERPLSGVEREWGWVHTFDTNNAYLAALINAEVARSELEHVGPQLFDPKLPGYWLIALDPTTIWLGADGRPPLVGSMHKGCAWVTTPIAKLLTELGDRGEVLDSWTAIPMPSGVSPAGRQLAPHSPSVRAFRKLGEQLRDALADAPAALTLALKRTYKDLPGALQRESMRVYRLDWAHTVIDLARANLYRRMMRIRLTEGVWPCRVETDSISYADCVRSVNHWHGVLPISSGLGNFKHEATHSTAEWLDRKAA